MKLPKTVKRLCPKCRKHTEHKFYNQKNKAANQTHPMSKGSKNRLKGRGLKRGFGNKGSYSKRPVGSRKMSGAKTCKKTDLRYTCSVCKKTTISNSNFRAKKIEFQ